MKDWETLLVGEELTEAINGKTVAKCKVDYSNLIFRFTDGSALRIEYDWIYGWELQNPPHGEKGHSIELLQAVHIIESHFILNGYNPPNFGQFPYCHYKESDFIKWAKNIQKDSMHGEKE